ASVLARSKRLCPFWGRYAPTKHLTIGTREGSFEGMLTNRIFKIVWITPSSPRGLDWERAADKEMLYSGNAMSIFRL
ncbi:MAG: DUF5110 domain-containing protein, partial [Chitinophagaceae bacterium]